MKQAMTSEDIIKSIEFELAQSAISQTDLGESVSAVRQYQNKARAEIFESDKLLKDTRALVNRQSQINDMHLTLLQEMAMALRAMELDVRRLGQVGPRPKEASRVMAPPIQLPSHDTPLEPLPPARDVPPPGDEPSLGAGGHPVQILADIHEDIKGKHVLLVEDIVDSGVTVEFIKRRLLDRGPASLKVCVLLDKAERRTVQIEADYAGFRIPNKYVVGYGLDYEDRYRNLPYIAVLPLDERQG